MTSASRPAEDGDRACRSAPMLTRELATAPNNLEAFWMPFTANRDFKANPRLIAGADGVHYTMLDGRRIIDSAAWSNIESPEDCMTEADITLPARLSTSATLTVPLSFLPSG